MPKRSNQRGARGAGKRSIQGRGSGIPRAMRVRLSPSIERHRVLSGNYATTAKSGPQGVFRIPGPNGMTLLVVASDGSDWTECKLPEPVWEHVSVSTARRRRSWNEMAFVKSAFWGDEETVIEFHVPVAEHISFHDFTLHLWRPIGVELPRPPAITVAPAAAPTP